MITNALSSSDDYQELWNNIIGGVLMQPLNLEVQLRKLFADSPNVSEEDILHYIACVQLLAFKVPAVQ